MRRFLFFSLIALSAGCSSPPPSQTFLNASIRIHTSGENSSDTALLRIKPIDLYNAFDTNVIEKKWKRVDDASWSFVFKGKDPSTNKKNTIIITLTSHPGLNNEVIVSKVRVNYTDYTPGMIVELMRQFDTTFVPRK